MQQTLTEKQKLLAEKAEMERIIGVSPAILYRHVWDASREQFINAYVSPVFTTLFGYDKELFGNLNWWLEYVHPDDMLLVKRSIKQLFETGEADYAFRFATRSGEYVWIQDSPRLQRDSDGQPVEIIGSCMDVTATKKSEFGRQQATEQLQCKESEYQALYAMLRRMCDNLPDMIWAKDLDNRYIFTNKALCDNLLHASDTDEPIGKTDMFFADRERAEHADDPQWHSFGEMCRDSDAITLTSGKPGQFDEFGNVRGKFLCLDVYKAPMLDANGEAIGVVGCGRDVTKLRAAEKHLRKLSTAIEQAGESIIITDREGIIEYVNPAFTKITGYSAEDAIGQTPRILNSGHQDVAFYETMWEQILNGHIWQSKLIDRKKDGSFYPTTLTISPIVDESGDATHFVGIQSDLTRIEDLEHQFHQAQKMEAIGTLVGGIAHDFNNMLAGMTGNVFLAKHKSQTMPDVHQNLVNIEHLCFRAAAMIQQLLTFARKDMVSMKSMPLVPYIKESLKLMRASVPENIAIDQDICRDSLRVTGDHTLLHQVLMNLMTNARDAVEKVAGPRITIRLEAWRASDEFLESHAYFTSDLYAHLSVQDNGCGISEQQLVHLFEPFFTTKEVGKGTGLGLAMVYGAVKTHHGFVEVESVEGEGSTFHVYLPLLEPVAQTDRSLQQGELVYGHGEMILLVDDEQHIIKTGKKVLEVLGYRVMTATDGQQAVDIFQAHAEAIDLCIFDVVMPVMGGDVAARMIRENHPEAKIIFASGYDQHLLQGMAEEALLSKPFAIEELSRVIAKEIAPTGGVGE